MRKRVFSVLIAALLLLVIIAPVHASPILRAPGNKPRLIISGATAFCSAIYKGSRQSDFGTITLTLKQGKAVIATWRECGAGSAAISETYAIQTGKTYELVMSVTVNGVSQPGISVTARSDNLRRCILRREL